MSDGRREIEHFGYQRLAAMTPEERIAHACLHDQRFARDLAAYTAAKDAEVERLKSQYASLWEAIEPLVIDEAITVMSQGPEPPSNAVSAASAAVFNVQTRVGRLHKRRTGKAAVIERLRELEAKLPKTADGAPMYLGMKVWLTPTRHLRLREAHIVALRNNSGRATVATCGATESVLLKDIHSTREAAEAAKETT